MGRRLVDGAKDIRIAGEDVAVRAQLHTLNGFSAHADRDDLLKWAESFPQKARFIVVHGEPKSAESLALALKSNGYTAIVPAIEDEIDLMKPAAEIEKMPILSPRIIDRVRLTPEDIAQTLSAITSRAEEMQHMAIENRDYRDIMPLLISARTLLETAAYLGKKDKKSA